MGEPFDAGLAQITDAITVAGGYPLMLTTVDDQASVGQLEARFTAQREAEWAEFTADWGKYEAELALILGACPLCGQPLTLDRLSAALAGT